MEKLIKSIEKTTALFEEVSSLEVKLTEREAQILEKIVKKIMPIMRFMDDTIQVYEWSPYNKRGEEKYYHEKGIVLFDCYTEENTGSYPHANDYWDFVGSQFVITRSGKLVEFIRNGNGSNWQRDDSSWEADGSIISFKELLKQYSFKEIIKSISRHFEKKIEEEKKKAPILESRKKVIDDILDSLK